MDIRPIRTEKDHTAALARVEALWGAPAESDAGDELEVLVTLIERYEEGRWPTPRVTDPVGYLRAFMDLSGRGQRDLAELLGSRPRASELLAGRRSLTLEQIRLLHRHWGVPADCLVGELEGA